MFVYLVRLDISYCIDFDHNCWDSLALHWDCQVASLIGYPCCPSQHTLLQIINSVTNNILSGYNRSNGKVYNRGKNFEGKFECEETVLNFAGLFSFVPTVTPHKRLFINENHHSSCFYSRYFWYVPEAVYRRVLHLKKQQHKLGSGNFNGNFNRFDQLAIVTQGLRLLVHVSCPERSVGAAKLESFCRVSRFGSFGRFGCWVDNNNTNV